MAQVLVRDHPAKVDVFRLVRAELVADFEGPVRLKMSRRVLAHGGLVERVPDALATEAESLAFP